MFFQFVYDARALGLRAEQVPWSGFNLLKLDAACQELWHVSPASCRHVLMVKDPKVSSIEAHNLRGKLCGHLRVTLVHVQLSCSGRS